MWFANGINEHDVMVLAGHSSFATTHEFYLAVADNLIGRAGSLLLRGCVKNWCVLVRLTLETEKWLTACTGTRYAATT